MTNKKKIYFDENPYEVKFLKIQQFLILLLQNVNCVNLINFNINDIFCG